MDNMYIILDYNLRIAFVMTFQKLMTSTNEKNIMQGKEDGSMFLKTIVLSTSKTKKTSDASSETYLIFIFHAKCFYTSVKEQP